MTKLTNLSSSGTVRVLGQAGVAIIHAGNGSMGNNGVLTLTTALVATYADAFILFPAGAIATGVPAAAAYYYVQMSSGTAGVVFNNVYTPGSTPVIPLSPTAFVTTGPGAFTGVSAATVAFSLPIAGNSLGINGGVEINLSQSFTNFAGNKTTALAFGAFTLLSQTIATNASFAGIYGFKNGGKTGAQAAISQNGTPFQAANGAIPRGTVDTTSSVNITLAMTNTTPLTNNMILEQITVWSIPGV